MNYHMRARMLRSRGEDLAGAADVDEAQPGQLEVNGTRAAGQLHAERLVQHAASGYVGFASQKQALLPGERAGAQRDALGRGAARSALPMSNHVSNPAPATVTENRSYYDTITDGNGDGNFRAAGRALVRHGHGRG